MNPERRTLFALGAGLAAGLAEARSATTAGAAESPEGARTLGALSECLAKAPRRREFKSVPMILDRPDLWDHEALSAVIAYRGGPRQVWDNTEIGGPWLNLMRNARQAIELQPNRKTRGRVTLTAIKTAQDVVLIVADNGPGIPERARDKLFQPFSSSATPGGSGLGLAISRELAQLHGGDVRLVQTGPDGTTFEIRLPLKG